MDQNILKPDISSETVEQGTRDGISPEKTYSDRDMNFLSLQGFFGIENSTSEQQDSMSYIMQFFEEAGVRNMSEVLMSLKGIENRLGITPMGTNRLTSIKNYLKISNSIAEMQKQQQAMER